ncbi:putative E3 ubiquitin-protein ligase TRIM8 [Solea senegalensis]|uniref:E3 ubiquitin-protein ligase TRIM8 n=1 Tax=Solea senegalensis TaxID=28829 RepID=A0AAV6S4T3_SOLSE|nr:E3 ubiquitin-protein ligase TRIM8-like [Solea senegalensis]KAG7512421.1 putative E3 ubiquitin-protein ligase TRIM8 [Solea senegalensis]
MDASWKNSLEEELLCPICLNVFEEPIQLPCKHNFCKTCISEAWSGVISTGIRCPECNHEYNQKPTLDKNFKLANIANRFNALNTEKVPVVLQCVLCRRGPPLPVRKVCLRCKEPCCQTHIHMHLQQPCAAPGHLLVDADELSAWTCPTHEEYRILHCEEEQVALCPLCCISHCSKKRHPVRDVDTKHIQVQAMLMKQQGKLEGRVQIIDEQITKLETDGTLMKDAVSELKERVRAQYQRMHALLEAKQAEAMQMLESTCTMYERRNSHQALQLKDRRHETEKLLSMIHTLFQRSESINCVKNTKPYKLLLDRSNSHLSSAIPPVRLGQISSHELLSDLSVREKELRKTLEEPFKEATILEFFQPQSRSAGSQTENRSVLKKRKCSMSFVESDTENSTSQDHLHSSSKKPFLHRALSMYSTEFLSQNPHAGPGHSQPLDPPAHPAVVLGSSSSQHSGTVFPSSHFPGGGASTQAMYEGRNVLMCTQNNCCYSRASAARVQPPYPASDSFPSRTSQEFPAHVPLSASQPLQHYPIRGLMETSQTARHPDFYSPYGQSLDRLVF